MPLYDMHCKICEEKVYDILKKYDEEYKCPECDNVMIHTTNCTHYKLIYNNKTDMCDWTGASSQYWNDYNAAKARGEKVKPQGED